MEVIGIVYKVENLENGMLYIGATTKSIEERKADHISKSKTGNGSYFQEAIGTYGPEAFFWETIDTAYDLNELAHKESHYIKKFRAIEKGYNKDTGGGFRKNVYQYTDWGWMVGEWSSLSWAALSVVGKTTSISNACLGHCKSYKGYFWSYELLSNFEDKSDVRKKMVSQYDHNNMLMATYESVSEASRVNGISKSCISRCCRGEREQTSGSLWIYK